MDLQLTGKRALITGSSRGIGRAIAERLTREGVRVIVHGLEEAECEETVHWIRRNGGDAHWVASDICTENGITSLVTMARNTFGAIDILVNNAGGQTGTPGAQWEEVGIDDWLATYHLNVLSAVRLIHTFLPDMKAEKWGRIIQVASIAASAALTAGPHYAAAKAALVNLTVTLTKALAGTGITVNTISPGSIVTPAFQNAYIARAALAGQPCDWPSVEQAEVQKRQLAAGRLGAPEDIADMVAYLVSPLAGYICGTNTRIDGGQSGFIN
ncbi:MAG: SDR family oxidoreductase [Azonexus sp.]|jgi:NAD(P)-dependent dehydrogenase (short-subunit alcohol dehydrogenase family)|nr:SDR family oxidoreductase [Azonexus sp.]